MAVQFFRIEERGSLTNPTLVAMGTFAVMAATSAIIFREWVFVTLFMIIPAEYLFCAVAFAQPFRVSIARLMHWTRYPFISSAPVKSTEEWEEASAELFKRLGVKLYDFGASAQHEAEAETETEVKTLAR